VIQLLPVRTIPDIEPGTNLAAVIGGAILRSGYLVERGDVLVIAQKIVSKAEGRIVRLEEVEPSDFAKSTAAVLGGKDPRVIELILRETRRIVRMDRGVLIAETLHGFVCANAGVDLSNVDGGVSACLLPTDPDSSAAQIAAGIAASTGVDIPVIVSDTFGRPWREGLVEVAIGIHGMAAVRDYRTQLDSRGYELRATVVADADQLAAAAGLVFQKNSGVPACLIRGFDFVSGPGSARRLVRDATQDLFR
jgi:coenzyme F420-0:L-glutamate ligase/coenzyme F420-1:gamma-L-glutamate ligase